MGRDLECPESAPEIVRSWGGVDAWLDEEGLPDGLPYLLSPQFEYDVDLNAYFRQPHVMVAPWNTNANRGRALCGFLNFLWSARGGRSWRNAREEDHLAYHAWRREDEAGPTVEGGTWSQEVSHVNQFYVWAMQQGHVAGLPIPQRPRRPGPSGVMRRASAVLDTVPATFAHDERGQRIEWLPPTSYRLWRDLGVRGFGPDGLLDASFRGRWASRNALFSDTLVRTGMRLSEQAHVTIPEIPLPSVLPGYRRFWLPGVIAKYFSARWVYLPGTLVREAAFYIEVDRAEAVAEARSARRYDRVRRPLVIADLSQPDVVHTVGQAGRRLKLHQLKDVQRRRLMMETDDGLEPAMFWLGEHGMPMTASGWKTVFRTANQRCSRLGVNLAVHPHLLRHTFAVITLEQLQRGHIAQLAEMNEAQRGHYVRVFGDPLDWVRRRLGHKTILSTLIYLHALQELEMETRMALVPDNWEDVRKGRLADIGDDTVPPAGMEEPVVA